MLSTVTWLEIFFILLMVGVTVAAIVSAFQEHRRNVTLANDLISAKGRIRYLEGLLDKAFGTPPVKSRTIPVVILGTEQGEVTGQTDLTALLAINDEHHSTIGLSEGRTVILKGLDTATAETDEKDGPPSVIKR